ncbi:hypothetical protein [Bartonella sp. WD16.2]|nr:hypothetical protein [Bartonella sp. WD16.2]
MFDRDGECALWGRLIALGVGVGGCWGEDAGGFGLRGGIWKGMMYVLRRC